jgi:hypothetical protein
MYQQQKKTLFYEFFLNYKNMKSSLYINTWINQY